MAPEKIYLVGTVHTDLKGPDRIRKVLRYLSPDVICMECDKEALKNYETFMTFRKAKGRGAAIRKYMQSLGIKKSNGRKGRRNKGKGVNMDTMGKVVDAHWYEYVVSKEYCGDEKKLELIDQPTRERKGDASFVGSSAEEEGMQGLFSRSPEDYQKHIEEHYRDVGGIAGADVTWYFERDSHMAKEIMTADGVVVVLGGLLHSFGDYTNLFELLKITNANVKRMKLNEADGLVVE